MNYIMMSTKITKTVECDANSNEKQIVHSPLNSQVKKHHTWQCKNYKKTYRFAQKR
jgi:hypothetical protein